MAMLQTSKKCTGCNIVYWLIVLGALNWGLVGLGSFLGIDVNMIHMITGPWPYVEDIIYVCVGVAALVKMFDLCGCSWKK